MTSLRHLLLVLLLAWTGSTLAQTPTWSHVAHGLDAATYNQFDSVAFGNGRFVAIRATMDESRILYATSTDGLTWTAGSITTAIAKGGSASVVRFLDGRFVIMPGGLRADNSSLTLIVTSTDGLTWNSATAFNTSGTPAEVAFGGGRALAVGGNGFMIGSTDFATWTAQSSGLTGIFSLQDAHYANGRWFLTANGGGQVSTSTDGLTFTPVSGLSAAGGFRVEYGNGVWFFYSQVDNAVSTDATTFTTVTRATSTPGGTGSIRFLNGRFVAYMPFAFQSSTDGRTWTNFGNLPAIPQNPFFIGIQDFAYGAGRYVAVGYTGFPSTGGLILTAPVAAQPETTPTPTPQSQAVANGGSTTLSTTATGTIQWQRNGTALSGATSGSLALTNVQPANAGIYSAVITNGTTTTTQSAIVGVSTSAKVIGTGLELNANITHPTGAIYDQILLQGAALTATADNGQAIRISYIDLNNDIVQVEFSGAGTLSLVLDNPTGPATPLNYTQNVNYMKGHAGLVITGANETTNLTVFSVGRATAFDPTGAYDIRQAPGGTNNPANNGNPIFAGRASSAYDGVADLAFVAIQSPTGKFGGIRAGNTGFFATSGFTGIYAPDIAFSGPVYVHDINASSNATPVLLLGSASDVRITGGDLAQPNSRAVQVSGVTTLNFTAGTNSHGTSLAAQANQARLERNGTDVTAQLVPSSGGSSSGTELTFGSAANGAPYTNGAKKRFEASNTQLRFDSTTLTNPAPMNLASPFSGYQFTDPATGLVWEVILRNGALYEINLLRNGQFLGQWS